MDMSAVGSGIMTQALAAGRRHRAAVDRIIAQEASQAKAWFPQQDLQVIQHKGDQLRRKITGESLDAFA